MWARWAAGTVATSLLAETLPYWQPTGRWMMSGRRVAQLEERRPLPDNVPPFDRAIKLWRVLDVDCAIYLPSHLYAFNGYVRLPEQHPDALSAFAYDAFDDARRVVQPEEFVTGGMPIGKHTPVGYYVLTDLDVHGGLTYGPDADGWVGFDTSHAGDDWPNEEIAKYVQPRSQPAWDYFLRMQNIVGEDAWPPSRLSHRMEPQWGRSWTMERLAAEVETLALQVVARANWPKPVR
jgi:hypothetical protein